MKNLSYDLDKVFNTLDIHCRVNGRYGFTIPYLIKLSSESIDTSSIADFLFEYQKIRKYTSSHCAVI